MIKNRRMLLIEYDKKVTVYGDDAKYAIMNMENGTLDPGFYQGLSQGMAFGMHSTTFGIVDFVDNILQGSTENSFETLRDRNMQTNKAVMLATTYWRNYGGFTFEYISPKGFKANLYQEYYLEITPPPLPAPDGRPLHDFRHFLPEDESSSNDSENRGSADSGYSSSGSTSGTNKNYSIYTVRPGNSFWQIAEEQMGSGSRATELARYNGMTLYSTIHPGDKLKIPLRSSGVSSNQASNPSSGGGTGSGARSPSSPGSSSSGSTSGTNKNYCIYTVRPGNSFWQIAEEQMGSGSRATELARYNGMTLYSTIHPGDKLKIPC